MMSKKSLVYAICVWFSLINIIHAQQVCATIVEDTKVIFDRDGNDIETGQSVAKVNISYVGPCNTPIAATVSYFSGGDNWITTIVRSNVLEIKVSSNPLGASRRAQINVRYSNSTNSDTVPVEQISNSPDCTASIYYPDTDGDRMGDYYAEGKVFCSGDQPTGWVANNNDRCPNYSNYYGGCPYGTSTDENINWTLSISYDRNGKVTSHSQSYFDELGKNIQNQTVDLKTGKFWYNSAFYDSQGRPALTTLSAPSETSKYYGSDGPFYVPDDFGYDPSFVKNNNGNNFSLTDYETSDIENPSLVSADARTLGWYYSTNNTDQNGGESYQDITNRPYSRVIYSELNPGIVQKTIGGNKIGDEWKQGYSFSMPAGQELSQAAAFGDAKYNNYRVIKTVVRDIHGVESVLFTDTEGKTLAAARSGNEDGTKRRSRSTVTIKEQGFVDVHIPVGESGLTITGNSGIVLDIYDLITEEKITTPASSLPRGFYRVGVRDMSSFTYNPSAPITIRYYENYYDYSLNEYDKAGRLINSKQPLNKLESTFEYNASGQLTQTHSVDEGDAWFLYREDGQIRFSINSKQWKNKEFSYTNYDGKGRPKESGVYKDNALNYVTSYSTTVTKETDPFTSALKSLINISSGDGLTDANCSEVIKTTYDFVTDANTLPSRYRSPTFLAGNVAKTENDNTTTWYSYDIYGRVKWVVQNIEDLDFKAIDYVYDPITGQITKVYYQKGNSDQFIHRYTYEDVTYGKNGHSTVSSGRLEKVETSTDDQNFTEHATYEYYETGGLKKVNLAEGLQEIDYVYNLNGALKSINHPSLNANNDPGGNNNDLFGMNLHYYNGDYQRNPALSMNGGMDQYNGNIKAITWNTNKNGQVGTPNTYYYKYDKNNWLQGASFNQNLTNTDIKASETRNNAVTASETVEASREITLLPGFSISAASSRTFNAKIISGSWVDSSGDYNVYDITYDANGNIQSLNRNKNTANGSNAMDKLSYQYKTDKPNQLLRVDDTVGSVSDADDIEDQDGDNYEYNEIGQLIKNNEENIEYLYNASGLVTEVKKDGNTLVKFFYNDKGHRVRKESYNPSNGTLTYTEFYIRDASGTSLSIYRKDSSGTRPVEYTVYGSSRLGVYKPSDFSYLYQLTDHLGNVRAVVRTTDDGDAVAAVATDYYPFGMPMPNRNLQGDYRYAYQGQEKDPETGKEAFELRLWDARIGRWLTTDPYGQYSSPYLGMGNDPINGIDPDGGWSGKFGRFLAWVGGGFQGKFINNPDATDPNKRYGISRTVWFKETDSDGYEWEGIKFKQSFGNSNAPSNSLTPTDVGYEWLTGEGPRTRNFDQSSNFTRTLADHYHMENTRNAIRQGLSANPEPFTGNSPYNLGGTEGFKYLRDVGVVNAFPITDYVLPGNKGSRHNTAAFFLGGYSVSYKVNYVDINRRVANVSFSIHNRSSIESVTRPPVLGYTKFWISLTSNLNTESGPGSNIYQNFNWNETIGF